MVLRLINLFFFLLLLAGCTTSTKLSQVDNGAELKPINTEEDKIRLQELDDV